MGFFSASAFVDRIFVPSDLLKGEYKGILFDYDSQM